VYGDCVLSRERGAQRHLSFDDVAKTNLLSQDPNSMVQLREKQNFSSFKHHAKVHSFRIITAILTWVLLGATPFYKPEWIRSALRTLPSWRPFPDTVGALHALATRHRLAVISNIDDDLFTTTAPQLGVSDCVPFALAARSRNVNLSDARYPAMTQRRPLIGP